MKKEISENVRSLWVSLIGLIIVVVILFIIGWIIYKPQPIVIQGSAEVNEIRVSGKVPGRIHKLLVEEGQFVHKGDTLVILDSPEINAKLAQANAAKRAALSQDKKAEKGARKEIVQGAYEMWQKAKVGVRISKKSFNRIHRLYKKGVVSAQKHDEVEARYHAALAQAAAAKSQYDMAKNGAETEDKDAARALVERAEGAIQEVEAYLKETVLVAPISGEISEIFPKQGELVGSGAPIMNIIDLNNMWFSFNVREDYLQNMKMGATMEVEIPALGEQKQKVKINYIKALASYATWKATKTTGAFDIKTFEVRAKPTSKIEDLRPGMSVIVVRK